MSKELEIEKMLAKLNKEEKVVETKTQETTKKMANQLLFTSNDIRNGIILSEILGPPKGRR